MGSQVVCPDILGPGSTLVDKLHLPKVLPSAVWSNDLPSCKKEKKWERTAETHLCLHGCSPKVTVLPSAPGRVDVARCKGSWVFHLSGLYCEGG